MTLYNGRDCSAALGRLLAFCTSVFIVSSRYLSGISVETAALVTTSDFFSKLNYLFFAYVYPVNIFVDDENTYFSG